MARKRQGRVLRDRKKAFSMRGTLREGACNQRVGVG